ncbi:MAG: dihydroorotase [Bacteroides sp.]|jgi:dihydroorotase|nr:dihydroorotase [Bacteroides sp.]
MAGNAFFLRNATMVNEGQTFRGSLLIMDGKIEKVIPGDAPKNIGDYYHRINLEGLLLLPGIIDDQVHFREPGLTHKGHIYSEAKAAVAGGVTSFMEMPNTQPQTITQKSLEEKFRLGQEKSLANYSFFMGTTNDNLEEVKATDPNYVCGIKIFMGASTGNMLVDKPDSLSGIFRHARLPVAVHCEDETTIQKNLVLAKERFGDQIPLDQHPIIRSHEACIKSSRLAVELAKKFGTRLHLLHLSTADEMSLLDNTQAVKDKQITAEVCIHHLWFTDADYANRGMLIKWNPAIKTAADRDALRQALNNGLIDVVATDHAPHTLVEKQQPYLKCPSGGPMVQHSLLAMLELVNQGVLTLEQMVTLMCHNPATCFQIKSRGFIREGYAADLVVIDPHRKQTITKDNILYHCGWSPMEGVTFDSSVIYTFVNGIPVYEKGNFHESVKGQALEFSR